MSQIRSKITGTACPIKGNEIDTDRIIPARFLKEITFEKMGDYLFMDALEDKNFALNNPAYKGASIMIVNNNFGCGSSREHAPQAIMRYGFNALIGESFAEIFAGNCKALGIPAVTAPKETIEAIQKTIEETPNTKITINLDTKEITLRGTVSVTHKIDLPEERRSAFLNGTWDELALLKANAQKTQETANNLPYFN